MKLEVGYDLVLNLMNIKSIPPDVHRRFKTNFIKWIFD